MLTSKRLFQTNMALRVKTTSENGRGYAPVEVGRDVGCIGVGRGSNRRPLGSVGYDEDGVRTVEYGDGGAQRNSIKLVSFNPYRTTSTCGEGIISLDKSNVKKPQNKQPKSTAKLGRVPFF